MKYLFHGTPTVEAATRIEAEGGPRALFNYLNERLKPEAFYVSALRREVWLVADVDDPAILTEVLLAVSRKIGNEPTIVPVHTLKDFGGIVGKAIENAKKLT